MDYREETAGFATVHEDRRSRERRKSFVCDRRSLASYRQTSSLQSLPSGTLLARVLSKFVVN